MYVSLVMLKKSIYGDFYGPRGLFVEHIQVDLCEKFQVNQTYSVTFLKWLFWALITAPPSGLFGSHFAFLYHFQLFVEV